jgi:hypothetical protein
MMAAVRMPGQGRASRGNVGNCGLILAEAKPGGDAERGLAEPLGFMTSPPLSSLIQRPETP